MMSDPVNIEIEGVYLYAHSGMLDVHRALASALDRGRSRWDDGPYLARIILCEMVKGDEMGTAGFGISRESGGGPVIHVVPGDEPTVDGMNANAFIHRYT